MSDFALQRARMVDRDVESQGIRDPDVLDAMRTVPREAFVPSHLADVAYDSVALPIGEEQTISQPYVVARMIAALRLRGGERVLEIGTGSGYGAAVLSRISAVVHTVELRRALADRAAAVLASLGYANALVQCGDGSLGWPEFAPYDAIVVTAATPRVAAALRRQVSIGGSIVVPLGESHSSQTLVRFVRTGIDEYEQDNLDVVRFVPLLGPGGWPYYSSRSSRFKLVGGPQAGLRNRHRNGYLVIEDGGE